MSDFFEAGGVMMWPILICALFVLGLAVRAALVRRRFDSGSDANAVLVWGFSAAVLGVLGTLVGVMQMANAIELAGGVHVTTVWSGIKVTLVTSISGMGTLLLALILWTLLRLLQRRNGMQTAAGT